MKTSHQVARRALLSSLACLSAGSLSRVSAAQGGSLHADSPTLVAYFSRTGNTQVVAGLLRRALQADVFEIRPSVPYPEDYLVTVEQARLERDRGFEPALASRVSGLAAYQTVFLGFPIWGATVPPVVRSFLSSHELSGKTLIPFITHGGYGLGDSANVIARLAPRAQRRPAFSLQSDQERQAMERVNSWLRDAPVLRTPPGAQTLPPHRPPTGNMT